MTEPAVRKFNIGDVVLLRSGGPSMTIEAIYPPELYGAVWFDDRELRRESFREMVLIKP